MKYIPVLFLFFSLTLSGQYNDLKKKYDYKNYHYELGDPYSPSASAVFSFLVPGLGQMYCGETRRGIAHLAIASTCLLATYVFSTRYYEPTFSNEMGIALLLYALIYFNSILDASRVAKIKNLAYRDKIKIGISPNGIGLMVNF